MLDSTLDIIISNGYLIFFLATLIEGPIATIIAGVGIGLGYYNFIIIFLIAITGDLIADVIYYFIGYYSRVSIIENHVQTFGLTKVFLQTT